MAFYFVCPGEVSVTDTTVQCSQTISTIDTPANAWLSHDEMAQCSQITMMIFATLLSFWLIKKAIDI
jgi:hypothetical protein